MSVRLIVCLFIAVRKCKMAFTLRSFLLLCAIYGLFTNVSSDHKTQVKDNNCPKGWTRLDCHCYIYQPDARMLADAESVCNILGGNVVSIHSSLENAFVLELFEEGRDEDDSALWIGLHDTFNENEFLWLDGSDVDFTAFDEDSGEPDDSTSGCVSLAQDDGEWDTDPCSTDYPFICITEVLTHSH
ncbi:lithostathine-1-beta-like [Corythoichthys intestinalis]|uniref:lithostathine-1-beta-like n=1 Tax=Corythoichthys intestinalis TaxID=161448 RepID=UPI0025A57FA7|nr:lithostathine-1-beta-like [Corythoichthys intestinalis]